MSHLTTIFNRLYSRIQTLKINKSPNEHIVFLNHLWNIAEYYSSQMELKRISENYESEISQEEIKIGTQVLGFFELSIKKGNEISIYQLHHHFFPEMKKLPEGEIIKKDLPFYDFIKKVNEFYFHSHLLLS